VSRADRWALFLDFDGTLVDIADRPDAIIVDPRLPDALGRLRTRLDGALAVVTGRPIAVIDHYLSPQRLDVAGLHGLEHRLGGLLTPCRVEEHPRLRQAVERLRRDWVGVPGILIEDKGCSVALHWRLAAADVAAAAAEAAEAAAAALGSDYRLQRGKAVAEILPASAAKGPVIARFLEDAPYRGRRPLFIGDDLTDEHGFATVNARGGFSVKVGREGATVALGRVASPVALRERIIAWADGAAVAPETDFAS
jgi:trehalose 6-phosphate phosphatase